MQPGPSKWSKGGPALHVVPVTTLSLKSRPPVYSLNQLISLRVDVDILQPQVVSFSVCDQLFLYHFSNSTLFVSLQNGTHLVLFALFSVHVFVVFVPSAGANLFSSASLFRYKQSISQFSMNYRITSMLKNGWKVWYGDSFHLTGRIMENLRRSIPALFLLLT